MATVDVFDISHHNTIESWAEVDDVPIVHKVNEGTAVDRKVIGRMPTIAGRHEQFGGYTVLIKSASSIRKQLEIYERVMGPHWRAGAMTQLDVEPWERYSRPVNADEIIEAHSIHVGMFGRAPALYINPRQMPGVLEEVRAEIPDVVLWEPHYGHDGRRVAMSNRATIHQWTSKYQAAGFTGGIDANEILLDQNWAKVCGLNLAPTPDPEPEPPIKELLMDTAIIWNHKGYANAFLLGVGPAIQLSPRAFAHYVNLDVPQILNDEHPEMLLSVLAQAGLRESDLTKV